MPAKTERQRKLTGTELARVREGKRTRTGMSEQELREFAVRAARKPSKK